MRPTVFHLIGNPGVGKFTVGTELAALTGARLVDNHSVANVLFNLLDSDGMRPLPPEIWPRVMAVRRIVLDTMVDIAPKHLSFIFTNYIRGHDEAEYAAFLENVAVADARDSLFVPVVLTCETGELLNRIGSESRRQRMKLLDPALARHLNEDFPVFETDHPNLLRLDTTRTSPAASARRIAEWAQQLAH